MASIDYNELKNAFDFVSAGAMIDARACVSRESGKIFWESTEFEKDLPAVPDDVDDPGKYVEVPSKHDLDLGKQLAMEFVASELPEQFEDVKNIFRRRGAYGRFKSLLEAKGKLDEWYHYEQEAVKTALCDWAGLEGFAVTFANKPLP